MGKRLKQKYIDQMLVLEQEKRFDYDVMPVNYGTALKVGDKYDYLPKKKSFKFFSAIIRAGVRILGPIVNFFDSKPKIEGRKNIKHLKSAITVSNHVFYLDNLVIRQALRGHKSYYTAAPFNNKKGLGGAILRWGGMLPFGESKEAIKNFRRAIKTVLDKGAFVHFYSEHSMWIRYEHSRPFKKGAFLFAASNNVPIVPMIFVFRERIGIEKITRPHKLAVLKILPPIYPKKDANLGENIDYLMTQAQAAYDNTISEFYNKKPN